MPTTIIMSVSGGEDLCREKGGFIDRWFARLSFQESKRLESSKQRDLFGTLSCK